MNLVDDMRKLQELHQSGGLTDTEFAAAKQSLLMPAPLPTPTPAPVLAPTVVRFGFPWGLLFWACVLIAAYCSNPDVGSLKRTIDQLPPSQGNNKDSLTSDVMNRLAGHAVKSLAQYDCQSYGLFSIGTMNLGVPIVGPSVSVQYIGAFGRWWIEIPMTAEKK